jgi:hypothetical protein
VRAFVGDLVAPLLGCGLEALIVLNLVSGEEVGLDVIDSAFDAAFLVWFTDVAGDGGESVVGGEVEVAGIVVRLLTGVVIDYGGFEVVDDETAGDALEVLEGLNVAVEEVFHAHAEGELEVEETAVTEDDDEDVEFARVATYIDLAAFTPVDLSGIAGVEVEFEKVVVRGFGWADFANVVFDDGVAAVEAERLEFLIDLLSAVGVVLEPL